MQAQEIAFHGVGLGFILNHNAIGAVAVFDHRRFIHGLCLPAYAAVKICTIMFLGLPIAESVRPRWGQLLVNLNVNPELIFMPLLLSIMHLICMV